MKCKITICTVLGCLLLGNPASAHMVLAKKELPASFGYSVYKLEWHADEPWESVLLYSGETNLGAWKPYPAASATRQPVEGWIGPVATQRWYVAEFYHWFSLLRKKSNKVWVGADICGVVPSIRER